MGFADFDIMGKCKTIIEKIEEIATNLSEVKTSASGAKASADDAKASAATAVSNTSVIGATGNTGGSSTAGTVMGKLNKLITDLTTHIGVWTSTRASYIDNIRSYTITNNTASKTGVLSAKLAYVISLLENTTYGLNAIKTNLNNGVTASVGTFKGYIDGVRYSDANITAYFYKVYVSGSNTIASGTVLWSLSNVFVYPKIVTGDNQMGTTMYFFFGYGTGKLQLTIDGYTKTIELVNYNATYFSVVLPPGMKISKIEVKAISDVTIQHNHGVYFQPYSDAMGLAQL